VNTPRARGEIWAYGLRNPWRFSFDRATGDLTISDVGQDAVEEIDIALAGTGAGANYGWSCFEGSLRFNDCPALGHVPPAFEYSSAGTEARCSITGGYVVRDPSLPALAGRYVYGDFCTGELRTADLAAGTDRALNLVVPALSSFGEDAAGRVYAASLAGPVFRLRAGPLLEPIGVFNQPVDVTSAPDDPSTLFVVEKGGTVKKVQGGVPTTFLGHLGRRRHRRPRARPALDRLRARLREQRAVLRLLRRSDGRHQDRGVPVASPRVDAAAPRLRQPQRRPAPVRARRDALRGVRRRRRRRGPARQRPEPRNPAREAHPNRPLSFTPAGHGDDSAMGIGTSLFLIAVGAILYFAVNATVSGLEIATIGLILMIIGVVGLVISLVFLNSARRDAGRTVVRERDVY
jgi:hypothetical protein